MVGDGREARPCIIRSSSIEARKLHDGIDSTIQLDYSILDVKYNRCTSRPTLLAVEEQLDHKVYVYLTNYWSAGDNEYRFMLL